MLYECGGGASGLIFRPAVGDSRVGRALSAGRQGGGRTIPSCIGKASAPSFFGDPSFWARRAADIFRAALLGGLDPLAALFTVFECV